MITSWIRFQQINNICEEENKPKLNLLLEDQIEKLVYLNKFSFRMSIIVTIFIPIVASFRVTENTTLHVIGAIAVFSFGQIYNTIQVKILYLLTPEVNSLTIARIRFASVLLSIMCGFLMTLFGFCEVIYLKVPIEKFLSSDRLGDCFTSDGYYLRCLSALFEWLEIFLLTPFFATFVPEFKKIRSHKGKIYFEF